MVVFGRDEAIDALSSAIRMNRSGLETNKAGGQFPVRRPDRCWQDRSDAAARPRARVLELIRFDMSEYMGGIPFRA